MSDAYDNARTDREMLARYGHRTRATAEEIQVALRDALNVYADRMKAEQASPVWAGPGHEFERTWIGQRAVIAEALVEAVDAITADLLNLTLLNGRSIEI